MINQTTITNQYTQQHAANYGIRAESLFMLIVFGLVIYSLLKIIKLYKHYANYYVNID